MAGAKIEQTLKKTGNNLVTFVGVRKSYVHNEQVELVYQLSDEYKQKEGDRIVMSRFANRRSAMSSLNKWKASGKICGNLIKVQISLPKLNKKQKSGKHRFVYLTSEREVIGWSSRFKISSVIELNSCSISRIIEQKETVSHEEKSVSTISGQALEKQHPLKLIKLWDDREWRHPLVQGSQQPKLTEVRVKDSSEQNVAESINTEFKEKLNSVNKLIHLYESMHSETVQKCAQLETEVRRKDKVLKKKNQEAIISKELDDIDSESIIHEIKMAKDTNRKLLCHAYDIAEELKQKGYSKVIDKEGEAVSIDLDADGATLDIRVWLEAESRAQAIKAIKEENEARISELKGSCDYLVNTYERAKSLRSEIIQMANEVNKLHSEKMKVLDEKISYLETYIQELKEENTKSLSLFLQVKELQDEVIIKDDLIKTMNFGNQHVSAINEALKDRAKTLEEQVSQRIKTVDELCILLDDVRRRQTDIEHKNSLSIMKKTNKRSWWKKLKSRAFSRASTITDPVQTEHQSTETEGAEIVQPCHSSPPTRIIKPTVQKASSYSASPGVEKLQTTPVQKKHNTHSALDVIDFKMTDQRQSWIKFLHRILAAQNQAKTSAQGNVNVDKNLEACVPSSSISHQSMGKAIRKLFNEESISSLASTDTSIHSVATSDSVREALRCIFGSSTSLGKLSSSKLPTTPCNSIHTMSNDTVKVEPPSSSVSLSSLREALRRLYEISDEELKKALPGADCENIASLGCTVRKILKDLSSDDPMNILSAENSVSGKTPNQNQLSTSNESLSQALEILFESGKRSNPNQLSTSNESLSQALEMLFESGKRPNPNQLSTSNESLAQALEILFESGKRSNPNQLSTSNESLAQALEMLYKTYSQDELVNRDSLDSILMWSLFDNAPEEYSNCDVKRYNKVKQDKNAENKAKCVCKNFQPHEKQENRGTNVRSCLSPDVSSLIKSASLEKDVNITFPKGQHKATNHYTSPDI